MAQERTDAGKPKSTRGFASMDAARQREIASKGGQNSRGGRNADQGAEGGANS